MCGLNGVLKACLPALLAILPAAVHAHAAGEASSPHWWTLDPWIVAPLLTLASLYGGGLLWLVRRQYAGGAVKPLALLSATLAGLALFLALIWPLDAFAESSFAAHMAQHMLLISVAGPLLALARTGIPVTAALAALSPSATAALSQARKWLRLLLLPSVVFIAHGVVIWIWHSPLLFELALRMQWLHTLEHVSFLAAGYWYWSVLIRHRAHAAYGSAALSVLATLMHTGLLGALITFAPRPLYPAYVLAQGSAEAALQDQQLAGLLMWIPVGTCYLVGGLAFAAAWLHQVEKQSEQGSV